MQADASLSRSTNPVEIEGPAPLDEGNEGMIKADTFLPPTRGGTASLRLAGIARGLARVYEVPVEERLPDRIAELVARLQASEKVKPRP